MLRGADTVHLVIDGHTTPITKLDAFELGTALRVASGLKSELLISDDEIGSPGDDTEPPRRGIP